MIESNCEICNPVDHEVKLILFNLLRRLKNQKKQIDSQQLEKIDENLYNLKYKSSLRELIDFILEQKISKVEESHNCQHGNIYNCFIVETSLNQKHLNILAQSLRESLAKRHYQLDILHNQTKVFIKTIKQTFQKPEKEHRQKKKYSLKKKIQIKSEKSEKVQEKQTIVQNFTSQNLQGQFYFPYYISNGQYAFYQPY